MIHVCLVFDVFHSGSSVVTFSQAIFLRPRTANLPPPFNPLNPSTSSYSSYSCSLSFPPSSSLLTSLNSSNCNCCCCSLLCLLFFRVCSCSLYPSISIAIQVYIQKKMASTLKFGTSALRTGASLFAKPSVAQKAVNNGIRLSSTASVKVCVCARAR